MERKGRPPPWEKHWLGACPTAGMSHIAIQEEPEGKVVDRLERATDEQYQAGTKAE